VSTRITSIASSFPLFASFALVLLGACADTSFKVQYLPHAVHTGHQISTLGVQRDGVMSRDGWHALGPEQPAPFGGARCDVAYSNDTFTAVPEVADALDSYIRSNGVTDKLLGQLAPAARGDTILFVALAGRPAISTGGSSSGPSSVGRRGGGGRRGRQQQTGMDPSAATGSNDVGDGLHVDATLFSIRDHETFGSIEMHYTGASMSDALRAFRVRLEQEFPGASCSGWDWSKPVDAGKIRSLPDE
jgi:hypothetical protein